jgi:phosphoribosylanthranilate isomerase
VSFGPGQPRVLVKVCGITNEEDAQAALEAGADALGFVFWPRSPRVISPLAAAEITRVLPASVARVGVFVDARVDDLARTADLVGLDLLQLHGQERPEACAGLPRPALKALRVGPGFRAEDALAYAGVTAGILLDTLRADRPGGTGAAFDWALARGLRERLSFLVLAGGLTPRNVVRALEEVRPHAVDVSSGVEKSPGRKDPEKLRAFLEAARTVMEETR